MRQHELNAEDKWGTDDAFFRLFCMLLYAAISLRLGYFFVYQTLLVFRCFEFCLVFDVGGMYDNRNNRENEGGGELGLEAWSLRWLWSEWPSRARHFAHTVRRKAIGSWSINNQPRRPHRPAP